MHVSSVQVKCPPQSPDDLLAHLRVGAEQAPEAAAAPPRLGFVAPAHAAQDAAAEAGRGEGATAGGGGEAADAEQEGQVRAAARQESSRPRRTSALQVLPLLSLSGVCARRVRQFEILRCGGLLQFRA